MLTQSPNYLTDFDQKHGIIDLHSILFRHFDFGLVCSGAYPASYPVGSRGSFPGVKTTGS